MNTVFRHYHIVVLIVLLRGCHTTEIAGMSYLPLRVVLIIILLTKMIVTSTFTRQRTGYYNLSYIGTFGRGTNYH